MRYALIGHGGMGRAIEVQAGLRGHERVGCWRSADATRGAPQRAALGNPDLAFEFTTPAAAPGNVEALVRDGVAVVCGTTGWAPSAELLARIGDAASAVVIAPNYSIGMALFYRLVAAAGHMFGAAGLHEPFVWEAHHRGKRDAPSGTARRLAAILLEHDARLSRIEEGLPVGPLPPGVLHIGALRAGVEPGTHVVGFDGASDRVTLEHRAKSRDGFALGAVLAAEWLRGRRGLWHFEDLLDESLGLHPERPDSAKTPGRQR